MFNRQSRNNTSTTSSNLDIISPLSSSINTTRTPLVVNSSAIPSSSSEIVSVTNNDPFEVIYFTREQVGCKSNASVKGWKCKLCLKIISGSKLRCISHMLQTNPFPNEQVAFCKSATKEAMAAALIGRDIALLAMDLPVDYSQTTMTRHFQSSSGVFQNDGEMLLLELFVVDKLAPFLLDSPRFKKFCNFLKSEKGSTFSLPGRQDLGLKGRYGSVELGKVLQHGLDISRRYTKSKMVPLLRTGGTLVNDAMKNMKRSTVNSVVMSTRGVFFAQSTDATGAHKNALWYYDNILAAIVTVGGKKYMFIVCLDGACKKTLKLFNEEFIDGARNLLFCAKIFGLRCSTHGCSLLLNDIGRLFSNIIELETKYVK